MPPKGGKLSAAGRGGPTFAVHAHIEGVEKTSQEFKDARKQFNAAMRKVLEEAGKKTVLPAIKAGFGSRRFGASLFVKRDRQAVFIGSRMRGKLNRAVGWWDFGGKRPRDHTRRTGPHVIANELQGKRTVIDEAILKGLLETFRPLETSGGLG